MAWILDHRWDIVADCRAIYHLSWPEALLLDGPELFALISRLPAYQGSIRARVEAEMMREQRSRKPGARMVKSEQAAIEADPLTSGLVEFGRG